MILTTDSEKVNANTYYMPFRPKCYGLFIQNYKLCKKCIKINLLPDRGVALKRGKYGFRISPCLSLMLSVF